MKAIRCRGAPSGLRAQDVRFPVGLTLSVVTDGDATKCNLVLSVKSINDSPDQDSDSDWVEAWHPSSRVSFSVVHHAVRTHQDRFGGRIDVGFLPKIDGSCHVLGRRSDVLRAVKAVCEAVDIGADSWHFDLNSEALVGSTTNVPW